MPDWGLAVLLPAEVARRLAEPARAFAGLLFAAALTVAFFFAGIFMPGMSMPCID
jgi:hypothetical protein